MRFKEPCLELASCKRNGNDCLYRWCVTTYKLFRRTLQIYSFQNILKDPVSIKQLKYTMVQVLQWTWLLVFIPWNFTAMVL